MSTLLALHGFTGSSRSWDFLPDSASTSRIIPALVGHFGSEASADVTNFEAEVDRLARVSLVASPLHLVGYSLGARLALGIAVRHPTQVARLTLISGHPGLGSDAERAERRASDERWGELLQSRGMVAFVDAWQAQPLWATQARLDPRLLERKRGERLSHDAIGLVRSLRVTGLAQMPDYREALAQLRAPLTLIAGGLDAKFVNLAQQMAKAAPHAELNIVDDAGHDLLLERPEFITEVIRRGNQS